MLGEEGLQHLTKFEQKTKARENLIGPQRLMLGHWRQGRAHGGNKSVFAVDSLQILSTAYS
ncbi:MAG: hypothetical protein C4325_11370 [Blastocatellia bacterium]